MKKYSVLLLFLLLPLNGCGYYYYAGDLMPQEEQEIRHYHLCKFFVTHFPINRISSPPLSLPPLFRSFLRSQILSPI